MLGKNKKNLLAMFFVITVSLAVTLVVVFTYSRFNIFPQLVASNLASKEKKAFPEIDEAQLSESQVKLISILKAEYALNPTGTKYSEGVSEAWCADFVSWVFMKANRPFKNPHSGSWRIPGTYTLREYYESTDKLRLASSDYVPKVGDILLYDNPSPFGQHTNVVLKNDNSIVTTIGGNEPGGIRIVEHTPKSDPGFIGYGVF